MAGAGAARELTRAGRTTDLLLLIAALLAEDNGAGMSSGDAQEWNRVPGALRIRKTPQPLPFPEGTCHRHPILALAGGWFLLATDVPLGVGRTPGTAERT